MEGSNLETNVRKDKAYKPVHDSYKQGAFCSEGGNRVQAHKGNKSGNPGLRSPLAEFGIRIHLLCVKL